MKNNKLSISNQVRDYILKNIDNLDGSSSSMPFDEVPNFELYPRDYLGFAEQELNLGNTMSLINCISHLKRATDCQLDTFLHVFNLQGLFRSRNLKFEKKLEFLKTIGIFSSRSLVRFNTLRNKMEHEYNVPKIDDLEVYFDLVSAFVSLLEQATFLVPELWFYNGDTLDDFIIQYIRKNPSIEVIIQTNKTEIKEKWVVHAKEDITEFAILFKFLNLLSQYFHKYSSRSLLITQLEK